ncbi:MAG: PIN domain-containing protein [Oscillospiraceae bacterium]|nr:PIN domain-containing protein [Oscillospiraceae bacterium]
MKNLALLIDTNVVLDWLLDRAPFAEHADQIMRLCVGGKAEGYLAGHTILNIFYITRKRFTIEERIEFGLMLCDKFQIIGIDGEMITAALSSGGARDLEDGLQMQCAFEKGLDYIITRDRDGFHNSRVKALAPEDFLSVWNAI